MKLICALLLITASLFTDSSHWCIPPGQKIPTPVPPECDGIQVDACIALCAQQYSSDVKEWYDWACAEDTQAINNRDHCLQDAYDTYDSCMSTATTPAEKAACRSTCTTSVANCLTEYNAIHGSVESIMSSVLANAVNDFDECCEGCCIQQP